MTGGTTIGSESDHGLERNHAGRIAAGLLAALPSTGTVGQIVPVEPVYELIDLGTPGALEDDFFPVLLEANAINENGAIVAAGHTGQDDLVRSYRLQPVEPFDPSEPRFRYAETGSLPAAEPSQSLLRLSAIGDQAVDQVGQPAIGPAVTVGLGLNDLDQVVGASAEQAFPWLGSDLDGLLAVGQTSQANAISDWGLIVGWTAGPAGSPHATLWSVWMPDEVWSLYTPPGWSSAALDIKAPATPWVPDPDADPGD